MWGTYQTNEPSVIAPLTNELSLAQWVDNFSGTVEPVLSRNPREW